MCAWFQGPHRLEGRVWGQAAFCRVAVFSLTQPYSVYRLRIQPYSVYIYVCSVCVSVASAASALGVTGGVFCLHPTTTSVDECFLLEGDWS